MSLKLFKLFVFLAITFEGFVSALYDVRIDKFTKVEGDTETLMEFNLRPVGRHHYLNGTIVNHVDFDETFEFIGNVSPFVNGEWKPSALNGRLNVCLFMIHIYGKYYESSIKDSNMPKGVEACPFKKGEYYMRNVEFEAGNWAGYASRGHNKYELIIAKNNITYGGFVIIAILTDRNI